MDILYFLVASNRNNWPLTKGAALLKIVNDWRIWLIDSEIVVGPKYCRNEAVCACTVYMCSECARGCFSEKLQSCEVIENSVLFVHSALWTGLIQLTISDVRAG